MGFGSSREVKGEVEILRELSARGKGQKKNLIPERERVGEKNSKKGVFAFRNLRARGG